MNTGLNVETCINQGSACVCVCVCMFAVGENSKKSEQEWNVTLIM